MRKQMLVAKVGTLAVAALTLVSCAHSKVNKQLMSDVKKVGILSISVDKLGRSDADFEVVRRSADFATEEYGKLFAMNPRWEFVPPSKYQSHPAFRSFSTSPIVRAQLQKMLEQGKLKPADVASAMRYMKAQLSGNKEEMQAVLAESIPAAAMQLQNILESKRQPYVSARSLAFIPYDAVKPEGASQTFTVKMGDGADEKNPEETLRDLLYACVGQLATELGLDALAIIHERASITSTVGIGVTIGDRGLDTIRMGSTVMFINREGQKVVDMGYPNLDALAHSRMGVPVYRKTGDRSKELDLNDPKGKVLTELNGLTGDAALGLMKDMENELAKQ
jgi:hypothetical protein